MPSLSFSLVNASAGSVDVSYDRGTYKLKYPCKDSKSCTPYKTRLSRGLYYFELYGASGGSWDATSTFRNKDNTFMSQEIVEYYRGNTKPLKLGSIGGSGGYTAGILRIAKQTDVYIRLGGQGEAKSGLASVYDSSETENDLYRPIGGYNGGGKGTSFKDYIVSSGGGATDIRAENDSVFNRVIVAGAGGGTDNSGGTFGGTNDGSGGAGGGLEAQGYFIDGVLCSNFVANQLSGFSFGQGESARWGNSKNPKGETGSGSSDRGGAGGGWFGGFASQKGYAGSGGGSSFALTYDAVFPKDLIHVYDDTYAEVESGYYAFQNHEYEVINALFVAGIWHGNGFATIKPLSNLFVKTTRCRTKQSLLCLYLMALF